MSRKLPMVTPVPHAVRADLERYVLTHGIRAVMRAMYEVAAGLADAAGEKNQNDVEARWLLVLDAIGQCNGKIDRAISTMKPA